MCIQSKFRWWLSVWRKARILDEDAEHLYSQHDCENANETDIWSPFTISPLVD